MTSPTVPGRSPIVVMASGTGSLLESLVARAADAPFTVAAIVVDRACRAQEVAQANDIPLVTCRVAEHTDRAAWDRALTEQVAAFEPDWVVTAGFMKILGSAFLDRFGGRIVNSHPALLPAFPGAHGVADALDYGVKVTGATVHLVDEGVDTGPILAQRVVTVEDDDTADMLHERIKTVERVLLAEVVTALVTRGVVIDGRKARIP
ncbi:phosphoribosylglycinamide formyltransferase [Gordonia terrae]|uniref:phosphoribosylglycinamide formyltransferase n=1 Tax=Gordonia terrae TaxID=2055 RepID=UPI003F6C4B18